jgi:uncharacterized protein YbjT (DUF2867 family)
MFSTLHLRHIDRHHERQKVCLKLLVLGATGATGQLIVREAGAKGHLVVALVRSEVRARDLSGAQLVVGDARDEDALSRALDGCTGVISSLGTAMSPFREVTTLSIATSALITAMQRQQVRRLVCITGLGAGDSRGHGGFLFDNLILPIFLRKVYQDKNRQEDLVRASDLDWVLVRPMVLNDTPAKGAVSAKTDLSRIHGGTISRADVAKFVVEQLTDDTWLRRAPLIIG